jgi:exo-beta-1,3-glucanase (GH17 family)
MSSIYAFCRSKHLPMLGFFLVVMEMLFSLQACSPSANYKKEIKNMTAQDILGNPDYLAICYGGYRDTTRDIQPTIPELTEDLRILSAMGIKLLRTYNVEYEEAANLIKAIENLKAENSDFEMYLMLGAWIDCKDARTAHPNHHEESENNAPEIQRAIQLAKRHPDIVKIIAVGNEAMVKWAASYYVEPGIILKWVKHLQALKSSGALPSDLWITSSDNFASWGGGSPDYHGTDLNELIKSVDFISMHTYPMHDTHYNPAFWKVPESEKKFTELEKARSAMQRSLRYAMAQYDSVVHYMKSLGVNKPVYIGETGWASQSNEHYGNDGSRANDEFKSTLYYHLIRKWTKDAGLTCFYFEAFDEPWKDAGNPMGSENHFGLINIHSQAKCMLWDAVDEGVFEGLKRGGKAITKTYNGNLDSLLKQVKSPPALDEINLNS